MESFKIISENMVNVPALIAVIAEHMRVDTCIDNQQMLRQVVQSCVSLLRLNVQSIVVNDGSVHKQDILIYWIATHAHLTYCYHIFLGLTFSGLFINSGF